jgi:hypothetical protein
MYMDASSGNIGVGTTSPGSYKLNVAGTGTFDGVVNLAGGLTINNQTFTDLLGTGLVRIGGQLAVDIGSIDVGDLSTGLAPGSVIFSDGTQLTDDNNNFFWDNISKQLAIGTDSPISPLTVRKSSP